MRAWIPALAALALLQAPLAYGQIYKCTENGKTVFTDRPCQDAQVVELNATNSSSATVKVGYKKEGVRHYSDDTWYKGASGYRTAKRLADQYDAPMILYFRVDWCGFCRDVERYLFPQKASMDALRPFVKVEINPEKGAAENALWDEMGGAGYPTFLVQADSHSFRRVNITRKKTPDNPKRNISVDGFVKKLAVYAPPEPPPKLSTADAYHRRAVDYVDQREWDLALDDAQSAIEMAPRTFAHYKLLDNILVRRRDWEQIRNYWNRYLQLVPDDPAAYIERSGANYQDGRIDAALLDARTAADLGSQEGQKLYDEILNERKAGVL